MKEPNVRGLLGLAVRSGQAAMGMENTLAAIRAGKALCVLMDAGAGPNTAKKLRDACAHYGLPLVLAPTGLMDSAMGREGLMAAALLKSGIAEEILRRFTDQGIEEIAGNKAGVQANNG